jgi:hypothetical protein
MLQFAKHEAYFWLRWKVVDGLPAGGPEINSLDRRDNFLYHTVQIG